MPTYKVALSNGKSLVLRGDTPPSDADIEAAADAAGVRSLLASSGEAGASRPNVSPDPMTALGHAQGIRADNESAIGRFADTATGVPGLVTGLAKGLAGSVAGLADYVGAGDAIRRRLPSLEPANPDQRMGHALERFGEVAVPEVAGAIGAGELAAKAPAAVAAGQRVIAAHPDLSAAALGAGEGYLTHGAKGAVVGALGGGSIPSILRRLIAQSGTAAEAADPVRAAENAAASDRMVQGMSTAGNTVADNPLLRTSTRPGILTGNMNAVEMVDTLKQLKAARKTAIDVDTRNAIDANIALIEKSIRQREHIHFSSGVREARKQVVNTDDVARQVIQDMEQQ